MVILGKKQRLAMTLAEVGDFFGYSTESDGYLGRCFESAITGRPCKKFGVVDYRYKGKRLEIKSNSGRLDGGTSKSAYILYATHLNPFVTASEQECAIVPTSDFIEFLDSIGMVRYNKSTTASYRGVDGDTEIAIQTVWNNGKGKPHSRKKYDLICDYLFENTLGSAEDVIERWIELD